MKKIRSVFIAVFAALFLVAGVVWAVPATNPARTLTEYLGTSAKTWLHSFISILHVQNYIEFPEVTDPTSLPAANYGQLYVNDATGTTSLMFRDHDGTETNLLTAGTGGTLDQAYDQGGAGAGKAVTVDNGAIALSNTDADTAWLLTLNASPSAGAALGGLQVTVGANSTQDALEFANSGSGYDIYGTGGTWTVSKAGALTVASLSLTGGLTTTTLAATGATTLGNGTATVAVNSSGWDITSAGAVSGISTLAMTDDLSLANGKAVKGSTTNAETIAIQAYDVDGATYRNAILLTNGNTPAILFGTNNETVQVNSSDWDISTTGAMTGIGAITMDGLLTGTAGFALSGAASTINYDSNFNTGINTGSSTGALSLGGGSGTVAVNSTTWDVSTAGAFTGVTGITAAAGEAMTLTLASNGAADDLTISVTGANDASLVLSSAGTGADAVKIGASAGGVEVTAAKAAADQFKVSAAGTVAGNAVNIATTDGGIVLTAGGAENGDMTLTVGDDLSIATTGTNTLTSADWGISATGAVTKLASVGFDSSSIIYHDTVELSNADIKGLRASPKALVAAKGANTVIELVSVVLILDYGSEVLTESTDNLVVEYATSGQDATAAIETTGFIDQAADQMAFIPAATIATVAAANVVNKGLQLFNSGDGEYGGNASNDTTMTVKVAYRVHADGL